MTEKEINELASKVANVVIEAMQKKQDDFDRGYAEMMESQGWGIVNVTHEESPKTKLANLREELAEYLKDENYSKASKVSKEIDKLLNKFNLK